MDYFLSAEASAGLEWQVELLIESFQRYGMAESLVVAMSDSGVIHYPRLHHVNKHKRSWLFRSQGKRKGFQPLDQVYALSHCLAAKEISSPYFVLQPHVVLNAPIYNPLPQDDVVALSFSPDMTFTMDSVAEEIGPFWEALRKEKPLYENRWINLGHVFCLQNFPETLPRIVGRNAELMIVQQIKMGKPVWRQTMRAAWAATLAEAVTEYPVAVLANWDLCSSMVENRTTMFIEYDHGMPPDFNKAMFSYADGNLFAFGDPIDALRGCISTSNAHQVAQLAGNLVARRSQKP